MRLNVQQVFFLLSLLAWCNSDIRLTTQDTGFEAVSISSMSTRSKNYDVIILGTDYVFYFKLKGYIAILNIVIFKALLKGTMDILPQILKIKERKKNV